jgi:hypothetical protein
MKTTVTLIFAALLGVVFTTQLHAQLIVTTNSDSGPGSLRDTIAAAANGDTITFDSPLNGQTLLMTNGEFFVDKNLSIDASALPNGVTLNGNHTSRIFDFPGGTTNTLRGLTLTNGDASGSEGGAILINPNARLTVSACTLAGNSANDGGGIYNGLGQLALNNSTLVSNTAARAGGGIFNQNGNLALNSATLVGNSADVGGGGIFSNPGTFTLTNCIVSGNTANAGTNIYGTIDFGANNLIDVDPMLAPLGDYGGPTPTRPPLPGSPAIDAGGATALTTDQRGFARAVGPAVDIGAVEFQYPSPLVVSSADSGVGSLRLTLAYASPGTTVLFSNSLSGAMIVLTSGPLLVSDNLGIDASTLANGITLNGKHASHIFEFAAGTTSTLTGLTLTNGLATYGGAILVNSNASLTLEHANLSGNLGSMGGAIFNYGTLTLADTTIAGNHATYLAGGIFNEYGRLALNNTTLAGNSGPAGGGIYNDYGEATIANTTLAGNSATGPGGGIYNYAGPVTINNSTLTGNSATMGGGIYHFGALLAFTNTIVAGNSANSDTNIYGLNYSSGSHNLIDVDPMLAPLGDYGGSTQTMPPLPGSPAIDAGADTPLATDQRGLPRLSGSTVDIGAVELQVLQVNNPPTLLSPTRSSAGGLDAFHFTFASVPNADFAVLTSTNIALPLSDWTPVSYATESPAGSGQFQFTDPKATNFPQRFYRVKSP